MITNSQSGTNVHEIADGIYRINTPVSLPAAPDSSISTSTSSSTTQPMLFHTGLRKLFPLVSEAIAP